MTRQYISTLKTNIPKENVSLDFRFKKIDQTRNYILEELKYDESLNEKHKKVCRALNYFELFLF